LYIVMKIAVAVAKFAEVRFATRANDSVRSSQSDRPPCYGVPTWVGSPADFAEW